MCSYSREENSQVDGISENGPCLYKNPSYRGSLKIEVLEEYLSLYRVAKKIMERPSGISQRPVTPITTLRDLFHR